MQANEVAIATGWTRRMICLNASALKSARIMSTGDIERVAARAHAASVELAWDLLSTVSVLVLWDPLFDENDARSVTRSAAVATETFIINPPRRASVSDAVNEVSGTEREAPHLWGLERGMARMLVLVLRVTSPANTYCLTAVP